MTSAKTSWSARAPLTLGVIALLILIGGFGTWAAISEISGAVIASGRIEVERNRQVVQHPDGGVVQNILVDEGDRVEAGQVLLRLDSTLLSARLETTQSQLFELMARRGRYEAERDGADDIVFDSDLLVAADLSPTVQGIVQGQNRLFQARNLSMSQEVEQMQKRRAQITEQIRGTEAQQRSLETQLELIVEELVDQQALLDKGLAQATRVLALRREEASLRGQVGELAASKAQLQERITELEIEIIKLGSSRREEAITKLRDLQYSELEMIEQRATYSEQLSRLDITAPVSGIVYGLRVFAPRSVIQAADPVLFLVPQDRPLIIAAEVPVIHIDQTYAGQNVRLRFSALDQRNTPELEGTVLNVSPDAFENQNTGASFYRAEIELRPGELEKLPGDVTLIPGMPVEAYLRTEDRTPLAYLIKPLADFFAKAFRES